MPTVCYATPGTYPVTLTVTNAGGTDNTTDSVFVEVCTGIQEAAEHAAFSMQPNPAQGLVEVKCTEVQAQATVRIADAAGRLVHEEMFSGTVLVVDINHLSPGLFVVSLESATGRSQQRLVIR